MALKKEYMRKCSDRCCLPQQVARGGISFLIVIRCSL